MFDYTVVIPYDKIEIEDEYNPEDDMPDWERERLDIELYRMIDDGTFDN